MKILWFLNQSAQDTQQGRLAQQLFASRLIVGVTFLAISIFIIWAYFARLDQITRAPGHVIASSRTQIIQSQDGGMLEEMLVKEGDHVIAGQILAKIDRTRAETTYLETRAKAVGLMTTIARLRAEVLGGQPKFPPQVNDYPDYRKNQLDLMAKRYAALYEETDAIQKMRQLVQQELEMNLPLVASGDVSRTEVLRLQRQIAEMTAQIANKKNKFFQDAQAELSKAEEELAAIIQALAQKKDQLRQTELRAPVKGIVKNIRITTLGGVIKSGDEIMHIVPIEDDLVIEAKVSPTDIAFLTMGLDASVKIDAYDYTIYGDLPGKLSFISADTLSENLRQNEEPYYRIHVRTSGKQFSARPQASLEILPGMTAMVEIKTGSKTVLQYLTKPIIKTLTESLGEK
jgi:membrane fusion protein, adhesin transport system